MITFENIDRVHQRPEGTAGRNFRKKRKYFSEDKHCFEVCPDDIRRDIWISFEFNKKAPKDYLITERAYLLPVKYFTDDPA